MAVNLTVAESNEAVELDAASYLKIKDGSVTFEKLAAGFSEKYVQNSDCAVSAMGDTALSYIRYTDFSTEISSEFFYDTSGLYSNWSSNPTTTVNGKHGISCSPFAMNLIYGVKYPNSAYINGVNNYNPLMLKDNGLINYFYTPNIGTRYLAEYALNNGYAFFPDSNLSNVMPGDVLFTITVEDTDAPYNVGHCEVVAYWINDKKIAVWNGGANAPRTNVRVAADYYSQVKLCARFPFAVEQNELVNIVNYGEASTSHTVDSTWVISNYGLSEPIKAYNYYTAIFKMESNNSIADQYPIIRSTNNDNLSLTYSNGTKKPLNDIYCIPFWSSSELSSIRLGMIRADGSVSYDTVTVEWFAVVKGIVTSANDFIAPQYEEPKNDASLLVSTSDVGAFTPISGTSYSSWGGCYYYKIGTRVHVHVGISALTANTNTTIYTLPVGFRPRGNVLACGQGDNLSDNAKLTATSSGALKIWSAKTYALVDLEFDAFN